MGRETIQEPTVRRVRGETFAFARRMLVATLVVASVVTVLYFVWYAADLLMLVFAGILVSILLRGLGEWVARITGLGYRAALAVVCLGLLVACVAGLWAVAGRLATQVNELQQQLPQAVANVTSYLENYAWARELIESLPSFREWFEGRRDSIVSRLTGLASTSVGVVVNAAVALVVGVYLASQPELYTRGVKRLIPFEYRDRIGEVLGAIDDALWRWLGGRFVLMILNGGMTTLGLALLGVPLALTLGVLAGLLNFVPNFGPWIAAIPAVLIAFLQSPRAALYVALLYLVLQGLDAYVLTPLADRRSVELPPVLTITAQVLLGLGFGFLGIMLASPLTAAATIAVKMLYVEDIIGDKVTEDGGGAGGRRGDEQDA